MKLFNRILVPIDLGATSIAPLHYASIFARRFGAEVTLMYADELSALYSDYDLSGVEGRLRAFAAENAPALPPAATVVIHEHPVAAIVRAAARTDSDLVVMGTHGRRGWRRALAGSVADGVVRAAVRPVLVFPEQRHRDGGEAITRVLCPVNFTEAARCAATTASAIASAFGAELVFVHVAEEGLSAFNPETLQEYFDRWLTEDVRKVASMRQLVLRGGAAERVLDCVEEVGADLLVLGAQLKWLRNESVIGTTSERLLRFASVPVLTVTRTAEKPLLEAAVEEAYESR